MHTLMIPASVKRLAKISIPLRHPHRSLQMLPPTLSRLNLPPRRPLFLPPQPNLNRPRLNQRLVLRDQSSPPFLSSLLALQLRGNPTAIPWFLILPDFRKERRPQRPQRVMQPSQLRALYLNPPASLFQHPFLLPQNPGQIFSEQTNPPPLQPAVPLRV